MNTTQPLISTINQHGALFGAVIEKKTMPITEYIAINHGGNQAAFAASIGVFPTQVSRWVKLGAIVFDGAVYIKKRDL